jgi:replicative DNA helicase
LAQLVNETVTTVNIDKYCDLVRDKYARRQYIALGNELVQLGYSNWLELPEIIKAGKQKINSFFDTAPGAIDKDVSEYTRLVAEISKIELGEFSPGCKRYKLIKLSRELGLPIRELEEIYFKSLIDKENEPLKTLEELFAEYADTERRWLMHGILPCGITSLLHARGGTGKSLLAYHLAYCLLTGSNWDGFTVSSNRRIAGRHGAEA